MDAICTACLCTGRNLYFIGETGFYPIYTQILNEIPVYNISQICIRICWECRAMLRRMQTFKKQVKDSYLQLMRHLQTSQEKFPVKPPRLQIHETNKTDYYEPLIKEECDIDHLKCEEEHLEPETFVNDLVVRINGSVNLTNNHDDNLNVSDDCGDRIDVNTDDGSDKVFNKDEDDGIIKKRKKKEQSKASKLSKKKLKATKKFKKKQKFKGDKIPVTNDGIEIPTPVPEANGLDVDNQEDTNNGILEEKPIETKEKVENVKKLKRKPIPKEKVRPKEDISKDKEVSEEKPVCTECGKVFSSKKTYRYHLNVLHKGQNRYPCPRCGKVYQWKSNLGRHMRSHKAQDTGELFCELCDKSFASVATYRQHLRVSRRHVPESEFTYMCNECGKKFVNKTRLRDHIDWEHLKKIKFKCQLCNKPFKCHTSLYVHLQNVHRDKEKKDNLCHVCGKSYQNAAKLKYHIIAMHTSETPYRCGVCSAAFGWYSSLYRHIREVHYKMKVQPKKLKKLKDKLPLPPMLSHLELLPTGHQNAP